jgi:hypothetical protein
MATAGIKQRAAGAAVTGSATAGAAVLIAAGWILKHTWRRMLPAYWAATAWLAAVASGWLDLSGWWEWGTVAVAVLIAAGWRTHSGWIRCYRAVITGTLGLWALLADPLTHGPSIPILAIVTPLLGWPWWRHLRDVVEPDPEPEVDRTDEWVQRWRTEVIGHGVCKNTLLTVAKTVRAGVIEATIRLLPGTKIGEVVKTGSAVETCLDLPEGSVGWRRTGRAAKLQLVIVERSYIQLPVRYPGPTYRDGRFQIITYADGTPCTWIHQQEGSGTLNGLIVGSSNAGKSRALGVIIDNLLHAGVMVVVCDPQNGQSLPKWRDTAGEYHNGVTATKDLIRRLHAEVMERSSRLAAEGIDAYDQADPKIIALGIRQLAVIIDECHLVLTMSSEDRQIVEMLEEIMAICRKTGVSVILATQLPQMKSLGGSIRIRDAAVAGNALILRLSNRGSGTTVLPDDFIGDPFSIPIEIEIGGKKLKTAGSGYSRAAERIGMLGRVPFLDEAAASARHVRRPIRWIVDQPEQAEQPSTSGQQRRAAADAPRETFGSAAAAVADRLSAFGVHPSPPPQKPTSTKEWIRARLRISPQTANALLDRPDCPVRPAQLRAVLAELRESGDIRQPSGSGTPWQVTS